MAKPEVNRYGAIVVGILLAWSASNAEEAGPFPPAAGQEGSTAIHMYDEAFVAWATGWTNYVQGADLDETWTDVENALGPATGDNFDVVSLGNGGKLTMTFEQPIVNGPGYDFAVFGNSLWDDQFLELAYVEVSSDGTNFFRFYNESLTKDPVGFWDSGMDPTLIDGLAGKYRVGYGMPFDLDELKNVSAELDVHNVRYVRLVDIVGDGSYEDSEGRIIYDPHPTKESAGFDLEAVGVLNEWTPLHAWRVQYFGEAAYAPKADDDASWTDDNVPNLLKYVLDLDPTEPHAEPLFAMDFVEQEGAQHVRITYDRRADLPDARILIERREEMMNGDWENGPQHFGEEQLIADHGSRITVETISTEPALGMGFFRIQAERQ